MLCIGGNRNVNEVYNNYSHYNNRRSDYKFAIAKPGKKISSIASRLLLQLKSVKNDQSTEEKIVSVTESVKIESQPTQSNSQAPLDTKETLIVPKKRPYVEPIEESVNTKLPLDVKKKSTSEDERLDDSESSLENMKIQEPVNKKICRNVDLAEAHTSSSSKDPETFNDKCNKQVSTGNLGTDYIFNRYNEMLKIENLTDQQSELLEKSLTQIRRIVSDNINHKTRIRKTHRCLDCDFTMSHQCLLMSDIIHDASGFQMMELTDIVPECTTICVCGFAFFHSHPKRNRSKSNKVSSAQLGQRLIEHKRSMSAGCPSCDINFVLSNRSNNVCCDLSIWDNIEGDTRTKFYKALEAILERRKASRLKFSELYSCARQCCLVFHRCSDELKAVFPPS